MDGNVSGTAPVNPVAPLVETPTANGITSEQPVQNSNNPIQEVSNEPGLSTPQPTSVEPASAEQPNQEEILISQVNAAAKEQNPDLYNVNMEEGINLIPGLSKTEKALIQKRQKTSFSGLSFLIGLAVITLIVFAVNIYSTIALNSARRQNDELESQILSKSTVVNNNNRILDRLTLLGDTQSNTYSPKDVFNFWKDTFESYGDITSFEINNDLEFELEGTAPNIEDATKLWHLLSIDERIADVVLTNISNSQDSGNSYVFISFEGQLNYEYFVSSQISE